MHKFKILFFIISLIFIVEQTMAQQTTTHKNYATVNISYAFFGSGDLNGTAIGLDYTRMASKKFGIHFSYITADGSSPEFTEKYERDKLGNIELGGDAGHAVAIALYKMLNLGLAYKVSDETDKNILFAAVGLNYKRIKDNYPSNVGRINGQEEVGILSYKFVSLNEIGFFISLKYLHFINEHLTIGFHAIAQPIGNTVNNVGITLGSRF